MRAYRIFNLHGPQERRVRIRNWITQSEKKPRSADPETHIHPLNEQILNMLMVMSHDIRSPLISTASTLKLLMKGIYGEMDESVKNTLSDMYGRIIKLLGTAEDFLGRTAVVKGTLTIEPEVLDLRQDIIDPILDELSAAIVDQKICIDNRLGAIPAHQVPLNANKVWLKIVFRNLFSNAIKYGDKGCTIAFGFESHGSYYQFNVFNSGNPIPENDRDKLFAKFSRLEANGKGNGEGMGLGLYLVKEIVHLHGGEIWYEAKKNGSNFVFTLPCDER